MFCFIKTMDRDRVLCRLCECPVVDGGVQASQVDEQKFEEWCLDVLGEELAEELEEGDEICYFCVWDAELLLKSREADDEAERLKWWPTSRRNISDLKKHYLAEKVKPCWVLSEKISLPESDEEEEENSEEEESNHNRIKCIYCAKFLSKSSFKSHMRLMHGKVRIRCDVLNCCTYFHTLEEKEAHMKQVHEKPRERKNLDCIYCGRRFLDKPANFREHIQKYHSDVAIKCDVYRCVSYFKTRAELDSHFDAKHKETLKTLKLGCEHCKYRTNNKFSLQTHMTMLHLAKTISCGKCDKMFSCDSTLRRHMKLVHKYKLCKFCKSDVPAQVYWNHFKRAFCRTCKTKFNCLGLMMKHLKGCKQTEFKCGICKKKFKQQCLVEYHMKSRHQSTSWKGLKYKNLGFECDACMCYFDSAHSLKSHKDNVHNRKKVELACAHCPKIYSNRHNLCCHLSNQHDLLENKHQCPACNKKFFFESQLIGHMEKVHHVGRNLETCKFCGTFHKYLSTHMLRIHGIRV